VVNSLFSGLSVYGGMICAGLALLIYAKVKTIRIPHLFDSLAICFILAVGIGRLGCELSGDGDWGIENTAAKPVFIPQMLWANTYDHNIANSGV
uniref:prolipoprotein diacylglyceryl transferase family protein n=1 Tax=Enterococcus faecium TaxID=1352 RepID=UPI0034E94291